MSASAGELDWHARFVQQARWTEVTRRYLLPDLPPGGRVLEVGCGSGAVLSSLPGLPFGLDLDAAALRLAAQHVPAAHLAHGDALRLPFADDSFDACVCHFVLLWLSDPAVGVREMRRVTRPGGAVIAFAEPDYEARIDYPPALLALGRAQAQALRGQGADPALGRSLRAHFQQAGLQRVEAGVMGGQWGSQSPAEAVQQAALEWQVLRADLAGQMPAVELDRLQALDLAAWQGGKRILYVPTFYARGWK